MRILLASLLCLAACSSSNTPREICANGTDDDGNGKTDCDDPDCAGQPACIVDAGYWGSCTKCGQPCTKQNECFGSNVLDERPVTQCQSPRKCQSLNEAVAVRVQYDTASWTAVSPGILGVITTRWVSKTAVDGSAVTCATVSAAANPDAGALHLENSGRFQLFGIDVTPVQPGPVPNPVTILPYTGSGSDYLIFIETWSGGRDITTHLPSGSRRSFGCIETGAPVAALTAADDCVRDGGTCRTVHLTLPAP
ncbi:MAG: hypothetical protein IPJ65_06010 [Archangiaceae bacterium]|nr:hypothetical protein [Archangiaceae bacterium]